MPVPDSVVDARKTFLWTLGAFEQFYEWGFAQARCGITPKGLAAYDQLDASGYRPSDDQLRQALKAMGGDSEHALVLLIKFRDDRAGLAAVAHVPDEGDE